MATCTKRRSSLAGGGTITLARSNDFMQDFMLITRAVRTYGRGIVNPRTAKWIGHWDVMSFGCLFYTAVVTPFEVGLLKPIDIANLAGAAGAPDPVDIGLYRVRKVEIHHHAEARHINAAGGHVGGDQNLKLAALEFAKHLQSSRLAHVAM